MARVMPDHGIQQRGISWINLFFTDTARAAHCCRRRRRRRADGYRDIWQTVAGSDQYWQQGSRGWE